LGGRGIRICQRIWLGCDEPVGWRDDSKHEKQLAFHASEGETPVEAALRFVISCPRITVALNGFTTKEQIDTACSVADTSIPFSEAELEKIRKNIGENMNAACTGCGYCKDCPQNINIPAYMQFYNEKQVFGANDDKMKKQPGFQLGWGPIAASKARSGECIECGACEEAYTQHLPIIKRMKEFAGWEKEI